VVREPVPVVGSLVEEDTAGVVIGDDSHQRTGLRS
jgi:hypothetical protein